MISRVYKVMAATSLAALLAGCQSFPAVQQDLANLGSRFSRNPASLGASGAASGQAAGGQVVTDPYAGQGVATPDVDPAKSSASGQASTATTRTAPATTHKVASGETGWSVARKYGITIQDLATANNLETTMSLRVGQVLNIPARIVTARSDASAPGQGTPTPMPPSAAKPLPDERTTPTSTPTAKPATPDLGATRTSASGSGRFRMPVAGAITHRFRKGSNDGIDIAAGSGTAVGAAGSGQVAAITRDTDGVPIIVIRHEGDLMTVYAGMSQVSVQKGDKVSTGQKIGTAGSSGSVHFEVRKGFEAVDPESYL